MPPFRASRSFREWRPRVAHSSRQFTLRICQVAVDPGKRLQDARVGGRFLALVAIQRGVCLHLLRAVQEARADQVTADMMPGEMSSSGTYSHPRFQLVIAGSVFPTDLSHVTSTIPDKIVTTPQMITVC